MCRALGLEQVTRAMDRLDDDERGLVKVTHPQSPTKTMNVNAVNEPGLYSLSDGEKCSPRNSSLHFSSLIALSTALCSLAYSFCSSFIEIIGSILSRSSQQDHHDGSSPAHKRDFRGNTRFDPGPSVAALLFPCCDYIVTYLHQYVYWRTIHICTNIFGGLAYLHQ